jgi:hypothetical protein
MGDSTNRPSKIGMPDGELVFPRGTITGGPPILASDYQCPKSVISSSWSSLSDRQLGHPGASDRVFPIRSVVSIDPAQTPTKAPHTSGDRDSFPDFLPPNESAIDPAGIAARQRALSQSISETDTGAEPVKYSSEPSQAATNLNPISETSKLSGETTRERKLSMSRKADQTDYLYGGGTRMQLLRYPPSENLTDRAETASTQSADGMSSTKSGNGSNLKAPITTPGDRESLPELVTTRFKHIVTQEGHAIITGRDGDTLQRCEDEPIRE